MNPKEGKEGEKEKKKKDGQIESKNMTVITYISIDLSGVHVIYIYIITLNVFGLNSIVQMIIRLDLKKKKNYRLPVRDTLSNISTQKG